MWDFMKTESEIVAIKNVPVQPLWKTVGRFLKKLKIALPYDIATPLLGIYPDKTITQKYSCTPMFTAALFTTDKTWKQPNCPSIDKWIKKSEYYSAMNKNEIMPFVAARVNRCN